MDPRQFPSVTYVKATITPASVAANVVAEQDFTVNGVEAAHVCYGYENPDFGNATGVVGVRVSAKNQISIRFNNPTAGALVPGAGTWHFFCCATGQK